MVLRRTLTLLNFLLLSVFAQYNELPPTPDPQACGTIIDSNLDYGQVWFLASEAIACLVTVPFDPAVGTRFVKYYNQTLQFQSTSAFLKNPPAGYQQPAFDIFASLQTIQHRIDTGYYRNQYAFEIELQQISLHAHDAHFILSAGILPQFSFTIPYYLIAASEDGKALPKVYTYNETDNTIYGPAIRTIDGRPAVQWLTDYAASQSFGMLEPHAEWNQIMVSPSQLITGATNPLSGGATFYPGDTLTVTYEDDSTETWYWHGYYYSPGWTGPLATGGDFYNFFVLGLTPDNYAESYVAWTEKQQSSSSTSTSTSSSTSNPSSYESSIASSIESSDDSSNAPPDDSNSNSNEFTINLFPSSAQHCPTNSSWNGVNSAYPNDTIFHEDCLSLYSTGSLSGYFYKNISTAVLSIPTFSGYSVDTFEQAIRDSKGNVTGAEKVIIDLQSCTGGEVRLAFFVFSQFFPNNSPYAGSQRRDHPLANEFGQKMTADFARPGLTDDEFSDLNGNEWVVTNRIDAQTRRNFTDWQNFYDASTQLGDAFSKVEQYDLNNPYSFIDFMYDECHYNESCHQQWTAENIVLLTDGICSSACALFLEMMTEAGARTVVVGGIPKDGPMQAASGTRGAVGYTSDSLNSDAKLSTAAGYTIDTGMMVSYIGVTLRHQLQPQNDVPTQFLYQPATCRIYWTLASAVDYTHLWYDAHNAIWNDTSLCVPGSVNAQPPANNNRQSTDTTLSVSLGGFVRQAITSATKYVPVDGDGMAHFRYCDKKSDDGTYFIKQSNMCNGRGDCVRTQFPCNPNQQTRFVCVTTCTLRDQVSDTCPGYCQLNDNVSSSVSGKSSAMNTSQTPAVINQKGYCTPTISDPYRRCVIYTDDGEVPLS